MIYYLSELGFCPGVNHAIETLRIAQKCATNILLYGPLIHNENENKKFINEHVHYLDTEIKQQSSIDESALIVYPAHGHPLEDENKYKHHPTSDAICPVIQQRYEYLKKHQNECEWYYLGKANHMETLGFLSHFPFLTFVDENTLLKLKNQKEKQTGLIVQSTYQIEETKRVTMYLKENTNLIHNLTLCPLYEARAKQSIKHLQSVDLKHSYFVVFGSLTSSNCNELFNIIHAQYPSLPGCIANSISDLNPKELFGKDIYLTSSTSISFDSCKLMIDYINQLHKYK